MTKDQIDKFFKGHCSRQEAEEFIKDMDSSSRKQELIAFLKEEWNTEPFVDHRYDEHELLRKVNKIIDEQYQGVVKKKDKQFAVKNWYKYAAVLLVGFTFSIGVYYHISSGLSESTEETGAVAITKTTSAGQKLKFMLPDHSTIILNSSSIINYLENDTIRHISLSGEAYFEVAKNEHKPFVVHTGEVITTAIGTAFNIFNRERSGRTSIALIDGRVKVESTGQQNIFLIPGQQATFDHDTQELKKENWEYFEVFGWKEGILHFKDAIFADIVEELENWYGVKIELEESFKIKKHYTGKFNNEPLKNVLESLSFIYNFHYTINDNNVYLKFKKNE